MIDYMNRSRNDHIVTIEDPIEFVHKDKKCVISQREIGHDSANFAQALRAALRQDPDIILVGEMRDVETMEVAPPRGGDRPPRALHAAHPERGGDHQPDHLHASRRTRRTRSAGQLAAVIQGIVSQRLVVRADGKGRVPAVEVMIAHRPHPGLHPRGREDPADPDA